MESARTSAREELLREAERLFGTHGVEAVSLRDIVRAAGHRNESAVHYHFGSKSKLVDALIAERLRRIEARRVVMLKAIEADGATRDVRRLMAAFVEPLTDEVLTAPGGEDYVRFMAQAITRPGFDIVDHIAKLNLPGMLGVTRHLRALSRRTPIEVQKMRERMAIISLVTAISGWLDRGRPIPAKRLIRELIETGAAMLSRAPERG
ncbi:MAG: TetR family transcriptional regulator [Alphaproteobacteria bacterium]|nr:TetR family transcriptional regulator [Alphaproteobacteria bacterium]